MWLPVCLSSLESITCVQMCSPVHSWDFYIYRGPRGSFREPQAPQKDSPSVNAVGSVEVVAHESWVSGLVHSGARRLAR